MVNIPAWFAVDTRLGSLFVHLDTPQCFFAEMYSADLNIIGKLEHDKVINYVVENMVLDKPLDNMDIDGTFALGLPVGQLQYPAVRGDGSFWLKPWQKLKPFIEILCNNQVNILYWM